MIKVNLAGITKKPVKAKASKPAVPTNILPIVHFAMLIAAVVGGYLWYASLNSKSDGLTTQIGSLQTELTKLEKIIKQDQVYQARKISLENRIRVIEDLRKNQLSPVVVLDALAQAIDRTQYVWLSTMSQNNATFSMAGTGSSVLALTDFVGNLKATGYFRNINLARFDDSRGNYTFNMTCEFSPPSVRAAEKGGN